MHHLTPGRLGITAGGLAALDLFTALIAILFNGRIPWPVHWLAGTVVAVLLTVALTDHRHAERIRQQNLDLTERMAMLFSEHIRDVHEEIEQYSLKILFGIEQRSTDMRREVQDLTSTLRFTRIFSEQIRPLVMDEVTQYLKDHDHQTQLEKHIADGASNVRPITPRDTRDN